MRTTASKMMGRRGAVALGRLAASAALVTGMAAGASGCTDGEWETVDRETLELTVEDTAAIEHLELATQEGRVEVTVEDRETIAVDVRYRAFIEHDCGWGKKGWKDDDDERERRREIRDGLVFDAAIDGPVFEVATVTVPDGRIDLDIRVPRGVEICPNGSDALDLRTDGNTRVQIVETPPGG